MANDTIQVASAENVGRQLGKQLFRIKGGNKSNKTYSSYKEAEEALQKAISKAKSAGHKEQLEQLEQLTIEEFLAEGLQQALNPDERTQQAQNDMKAEIEAARLKALQEDNPILSRLFPYQAKAAAKNGGDYSLGLSGLLAGVGDALSLPGRIVGATIDEKNSGQDWGESLGQTYGESDRLADGNERNIGGKILQGVMRDPTTLPLALTGIGLAGKALGTAPSALRTIGVGGGLGAGLGISGGLMRPALEGTELKGGDVASEALIGGAAGAALPFLGISFRKLFNKATLARDKSMEAWRKRAQKYADNNFTDRSNPKNAQILEELTDDAKLANLKSQYGKREEIAKEIADLKFIPEEQLPGFEQWNEALGKSTHTIAPTNIVDHFNTAGQRLKVNPSSVGLIPEKEAAARSLGKYSQEFVDANGQPLAFSAKELNQLKHDIGRVIDWDKLHNRKTDFETAELKKAYGMMNDLLDAVLAHQGLDYGTAGRAAMKDALQKRDAMFKAIRAGNDKDNLYSNVERNTQGVGKRANDYIGEKIQAADEALGTNNYEKLKNANWADVLLQNFGISGNPNLRLRTTPMITTGRGYQGLLGKALSPISSRISGSNPQAAVDILRRTKPNVKPGFSDRHMEKILPISILGLGGAIESGIKKPTYRADSVEDLK